MFEQNILSFQEAHLFDSEGDAIIVGNRESQICCIKDKAKQNETEQQKPTRENVQTIQCSDILVLQI